VILPFGKEETLVNPDAPNHCHHLLDPWLKRHRLSKIFERRA
jgi:hypothetical protein